MSEPTARPSEGTPPREALPSTPKKQAPKWWIVEYEAEDRDMQRERFHVEAFPANLIDITIGSEGWKVLGDGRCFRVTAKYPVYLHPAALPVPEAGGEDTRRLDRAQELVLCADFDYKMERHDGQETRERVYVLRIPDGVRVGMDIRAFLDAARVPRHTGEEKS